MANNCYLFAVFPSRNILIQVKVVLKVACQSLYVPPSMCTCALMQHMCLPEYVQNYDHSLHRFTTCTSLFWTTYGDCSPMFCLLWHHPTHYVTTNMFNHSEKYRLCLACPYTLDLDSTIEDTCSRYSLVQGHSWDSVWCSQPAMQWGWPGAGHTLADSKYPQAAQNLSSGNTGTGQGLWAGYWQDHLPKETINGSMAHGQCSTHHSSLEPFSEVNAALTFLGSCKGKGFLVPVPVTVRSHFLICQYSLYCKETLFLFLQMFEIGLFAFIHVIWNSQISLLFENVMIH